jgi:large subunit ribosomal protein L3
MTQVYDSEGKIAPVTVLQLGPCPVLQVRAQDRDGYDALQLGFLDKPRRKATRPERGHVSSQLESKRRRAWAPSDDRLPPPPKADCEPQRYIREFRLDKPSDITVGTILKAEQVFQKVKVRVRVKDKDGKEREVEIDQYPHVDVIGTSKGRGMTGVMKRHNFQGLRGSHGVKKGNRQHGSIASNASNRGSGRPKKGIRMAGRYGNERVTVRNLTVIRIDPENHLMLVKGAVPGPNGRLVIVRPTNKRG